MEALSRREEEEIEAAAKTEALKKCDPSVKAFADCATGRTFSTPFVCRDVFNAMNACVKEHMKTERIDEMKLEYIAHRSEKGKQAVEALLAARREKLLKMAGRKEVPVLQPKEERMHRSIP